MSKVIEREQGAEHDHSTTVEDHELPPLKTIERPAEFTPAPAALKPSMFVRWMGWLLGAVVLVGGAGLIWWAVSQGGDLAAPIDPHESPEVLRTWTPEIAPADIDPHVSPEILRTLPVAGVVDPMSLESLELLRSLPTQGIDELSLESLELLRSLPSMVPAEIDPHVSPEVLRAIPASGVSGWSLESLELLRSLPAIVAVEIDPHVSPEVLRGAPVVYRSLENIDPHESPEILRTRTP